MTKALANIIDIIEGAGHQQYRISQSEEPVTDLRLLAGALSALLFGVAVLLGEQPVEPWDGVLRLYKTKEGQK